MKNYRSTERFVHEFIAEKKRSDIFLSQLDNRFITDFSIFLLTRKPDKGQRKCSNNTVMKHMERLKKMVGIAMKNKWMKESPFEHFERKMVKKDREPLDADVELQLHKVAGIWNDGGKGRTYVADLQVSDTTLRITDPLSGNVVSIPVDVENGTFEWNNSHADEPPVYTKVE